MFATQNLWIFTIRASFGFEVLSTWFLHIITSQLLN
jgi:hypothetical protein